MSQPVITRITPRLFSLHNQFQPAPTVCSTNNLVATMMPLVALNIKALRKNFHCFLGGDVVTRQFFFVEFKFELLRVELVPVNQIDYRAFSAAVRNFDSIPSRFHVSHPSTILSPWTMSHVVPQTSMRSCVGAKPKP